MGSKYEDVRDIIKHFDSGDLQDAIYAYSKEVSQPFWDSLYQESDRAVAIVVGCLLDNLLEKLIRAYYVKEPQVKNLFSNDHILQSFYAKINITFFSGLIPKFIYHDLLIICKIRNKFAHKVDVDLSFANKEISHMINSCEMRPRELDGTSKEESENALVQRIKFVVIIQVVIALLSVTEQLLLRIKPPYPVEIFKLDKILYKRLALTKAEIFRIIKEQAEQRKTTAVDSK